MERATRVQKAELNNTEIAKLEHITAKSRRQRSIKKQLKRRKSKKTQKINMELQ